MISKLAGLSFGFAKIGALTFGGGLAMLPLMNAELEAHGWMGPEEFLQMFGISEMTPGPMAINTATAVGWRVAGLPGALVATLSLALPSFACIVSLMAFVNRMGRTDGGATKFALRFLRPIITGMIVAATLQMAKAALWPAGFDTVPGWRPMAVMAFTFALSLCKRPGPIASLCAGTAAGALL